MLADAPPARFINLEHRFTFTAQRRVDTQAAQPHIQVDQRLTRSRLCRYRNSSQLTLAAAKRKYQRLARCLLQYVFHARQRTADLTALLQRHIEITIDRSARFLTALLQ